MNIDPQLKAVLKTPAPQPTPKQQPLDLSPIVASVERLRISQETLSQQQNTNITNVLREMQDRQYPLDVVASQLSVSVDKLSETVKSLEQLTKEQLQKLQSDILLSFSETSLPSGDTVVDFSNGVVTKSDKSTSRLTASSKDFRSEYVRSLTISTSVATSMRIIGRKNTTVFLPSGKYLRLLNHEIKRVIVSSTSAYDLYIAGSMEPDGSPQVT